jgi:hypothetical protein
MTSASYEQHVGRTFSLWLFFDKFGLAPITDHIFKITLAILLVFTAELAVSRTARLLMTFLSYSGTVEDRQR